MRHKKEKGQSFLKYLQGNVENFGRILLNIFRSFTFFFEIGKYRHKK